jgi:RND family efflux transporter MFP subunit
MAEAAGEERLGQLRIDRTRRARRRGLRRLWPVALAAAIAGAVALALVSRPPVVTVAQVREARPGEEATLLSAAGYVASRRRSIVAPKIPGRLERVLVDEGQAIRKDQVIARLDARDAEVALAEARARERLARSRLAAAEAQREKTRRDVERFEPLVRAGGLPAAQLDDARSAADVALAQLRSAREELAAAREAVGAAALGLDATVIRAPFDATVVKKLADEGAVLAPAAIGAPGAGGIVEIVDLSALEVEAEVSEEQLARVAEGQPALIFLDAYPDRVYRAVVGTLRPAIDRAKATGVVKVRFAEEPRGVLPDMGAKVSFLKAPLPAGALAGAGSLRVPASAVVERNGSPAVLVVAGGRVDVLPVEVERRVGDEVALARGPEPGTAVVTAPRDRLREGARVKVEGQG